MFRTICFRLLSDVSGTTSSSPSEININTMIQWENSLGIQGIWIQINFLPLLLLALDSTHFPSNLNKCFLVYGFSWSLSTLLYSNRLSPSSHTSCHNCVLKYHWVILLNKTCRWSGKGLSPLYQILSVLTENHYNSLARPIIWKLNARFFFIHSLLQRDYSLWNVWTLMYFGATVGKGKISSTYVGLAKASLIDMKCIAALIMQ